MMSLSLYRQHIKAHARDTAKAHPPSPSHILNHYCQLAWPPIPKYRLSAMCQRPQEMQKVTPVSELAVAVYVVRYILLYFQAMIRCITRVLCKDSRPAMTVFHPQVSIIPCSTVST